ncbi:DUF805 domain-containing protein [Staphylococcus arlettae]|uniref:DUF805 domain-containing protein n=1 Tax=Staphylococcus arlettae TaxID=29378 RepID=UPI00113A512B|nr:DUF805 domain-containing protein [Staphylococcus arlettae]MCD9054080.1 DUF805 domain-containing protein [Staphylococcus arlettae]MEB5899510.1 DUF805 domain-containing protein [Staphylococcus arlettae]UXU50045.1 DUF805 domain-containing protein [Staphylococcus arlettae]UXU52683.1 DUF805 domain-containing protein [Staphylococcus arlettae]BBK26989.1 hypothetical protein SAP2_01730 [Staphylococcus arlettae]
MNSLPMQIMQSYTAFWTRFLDVKGRASRSDFWHPFWINFLITSLLGIFSVGTLSSVFALFLIIPTFTVKVRRLHDTNRTMLLAIISHISGLITAVGTIAFGLIIITIATQTETMGVLKAIMLAGVFGTLFAGVVTLYTWIVLIMRGNKKPNRYGAGGSCQVVAAQDVVMTEVEHSSHS